jgi:TRAP-type C4-dicarboxylate transport system permease small subunit
MSKTLERWGAIGAGTALFALMIVVLLDVLGRNVLNKPLMGGTELTEVLMVVLSFLSFPLLAYRGKHIIVDLFSLPKAPFVRRLELAVTALIGAVVFGLLARQQGVLAMRAARSGEATSELHIPLSWVWWLMAAFSVVTVLVMLAGAVNAMRGRAEPGVAVDAV